MNLLGLQRRRLRSTAKWIFIRVLWSTGLLNLAKWWIRRHGAVVLSFHRVLSREACAETTIQRGMIVSKESFRALLEYLQKHYSTLNLNDNFLQNIPKRVQLALTFDDGWEDNASIALPIATEFKVPLTIFICPGLVDRSLPFWPDRVSALIRSAECTAGGIAKLSRALVEAVQPDWATALEKERVDRADRLIERLKTLRDVKREEVLKLLFRSEIPIELFVNLTLDRTMSWSQVRRLQEAGVTFGSHTQYHNILPQIPLTQVEKEIQESRATIHRRLSTDCLFFSYPNGDASPEVREVVSHSGFTHAFINSPGIWHRDGDPFLIPRINVCENHLTDAKGQFSPLTFEYSVFWRAFTRGRSPRTSKNETTVSRESVGSALS